MKVLLAVGLLLAGVVTGIATVALHDLSWGLPLGILASLATVIALPPGWWSRLSFVLGWVAVVGYLTVPRPEGDYVISSNAQGYAVLVLGMVLLVLGIATLPRRTADSPSSDDPDS